MSLNNSDVSKYMLELTDNLIDIEIAEILKESPELYNKYFPRFHVPNKSNILVNHGVVEGHPKILLDPDFLRLEGVLRYKVESKVNEYIIRAYKFLLENAPPQ